MSAILAVQDADVHADYIHVAHSWDAKYGIKGTKTNQARDVPLPRRVREAVEPFLGSGGFVFSMSDGKTPASGNRCTGALYAALEKIGVPPAEREARNITFHSWRHWLNSTFRAKGVPDDLTRRVIGHESAQMTDNYTQYKPEHFAPVVAVQAEVFE